MRAVTVVKKTQSQQTTKADLDPFVVSVVASVFQAEM
jgi:hypothetical protein